MARTKKARSNGNGSGEKMLESWIWDAARSVRGAKNAPKRVRFYLPLVPDDPEQPVWSVIRKFSDRICEGVTSHIRVIAKENPIAHQATEST